LTTFLVVVTSRPIHQTFAQHLDVKTAW